MAAACTIKIIGSQTGLGKNLDFAESFEIATTRATAITASTYNYRTLATANTAEVLDLGDVTTVLLVIIKCISGGKLDVDCDYVSSFDADIEIEEGEMAIFTPSGTVYVKDNAGTETPVYEYWVVGVT